MKTQIVLGATVASLALGTFAAAAGTASTAPRTLHFTTANDHNTDLDLGAQGFSAGDTQLFRSDLMQSGKRVGYAVGRCQIAYASKTRMLADCTTTALLHDGTIAMTFVFSENPQIGPTGASRFAVTGGTGAYRGATGEAVNEPIDGSDNSTVTIYLN